MYRYAGGPLQQLTQDHLFGKFAGARWEGGQQQPQPDNGKLTRAIGAGDRVTVDWAIAAAGEGSRFLLCTDGINKEMSDADIGMVCGRLSEPAAIVDELVRITIDRGGHDNLSAIIVHAPTGDAGAFDQESVNREL